MKPLASPAIALLLCFAAASAQTPTVRVDTQPLPNFHPSNRQLPRPAAARMQPRPAPLAPADIMRFVPKLGVKATQLQLYVQTIKYQIESYNNTVGFEVDTPTLTDSILYGATGYVQVDFSVQPKKQYLLDCSLGQDGTYTVGTTFNLGGSNWTSWLDGTLSSFNRHLLIPLNPAPGNATGGRVVIDFKDIEFYGCQVNTVVQ